MANTPKIQDGDKNASKSDKLKSDAKQERLAEQLRANLRRRKEQSRERKDVS